MGQVGPSYLGRVNSASDRLAGLVGEWSVIVHVEMYFI